MVHCHTCKTELEGEWNKSNSGYGNDKGRIGVNACFLHPYYPQNDTVFTYCLACWKYKIAKNLERWGISDPRYEQTVEERDQLIKEKEQLAKENLELTIENTQITTERNKLKKEKKVLEKTVKTKDIENEQLQQRITELEPDEQLVNRVYKQAGLKGIENFFQGIPQDDLETFKQLGFNPTIDTKPLERKHIDITKTFSKEIKVEISNHIETQLGKLKERLQKLDKYLEASLEGLEDVDIPQAEKDTMTSPTKKKINDIQSQITRWTDHKTKLNEQPLPSSSSSL